MYSFQFHIRDYLTKTRHLSNLEDLAYRRLLDTYYTQEAALPESAEDCARLVAMREHVREVQSVLQEFFTLRDGAWHNDRADEEIGKFKGFAEAGRRGAARRWSDRGANGGANGEANSPPNGEANGPPNQGLIATINQQPTTKKQPTTARTRAEESSERGSRLPADWVPSEQNITFCRQEREDLDPHVIGEEFRDYWTGVPGRQGVKLDWDATWRNWVRNRRTQTYSKKPAYDWEKDLERAL